MRDEENAALDKRLAAGERGIPKIPDAPVRKYESLLRLTESHQELLRALKWVRQSLPETLVNVDYLDRVILRGERAQ